MCAVRVDGVPSITSVFVAVLRHIEQPIIIVKTPCVNISDNRTVCQNGVR